MKHPILSAGIKISVLLLIVTASMLLESCTSQSRTESVSLENGFNTPPESAKPRVWWHWMNGNITKNGIRSDLQWMHRTGIGGFQNFDAAFMTPQIVKNRLVYMTPEWKDAFLFATKLADSLGLEMAIAGSPGWSESGGPWVKPSQGMKKLVWTEISVEGGKLFNGTLPVPPATTGPFQNIPLFNGFSLSGGKPKPLPEYYSDVAVIAYKIPDGESSMKELQPLITSSGGKFNLAELTDGDLNKSALLPPVKINEKAWIQFEFDKPQSIQGLTIVGGGSAGLFGFGRDPDNRELESGNDGKSFSQVVPIPSGGVGQKTISFQPVTAKYFRFTFKTFAPQPGIADIFGGGSGPAEPKGTQIAELVLHTGACVNQFEEKAAFTTSPDLSGFPTPAFSNAISKENILDLTSKMQKDGSLNWTPPQGKWKILRIGYSLTGHQNSPASPEATGLEVDKLSGADVKDYFENYLDQYKDATGGLIGKKGLQYIITDSWEAGVQNWTDSMMIEFKKHRGYEMLQWLPVLTGRVVESSEASDRFLWDFRKTIGDLTTEKHYDQLTAILKKRGMGRYTESHESGRAFIGDGMDVKRKADIPMSATWTPGGFNRGTEVATGYKADVRESASVAHIYGQNLVAAESMTAIGSAWAWSPESLKPTADMEMANGLNRFVIHTSVHQPVDDKIPGLGLGPFGQWFTRHETWAEEAYPWINYLSRSSYMLQQGKFVADIVYFYGEDNNITSLFGEKLPDIPEGYNYDFVNADALVNLLSVEDGHIITPGGMIYKVLALDSNSKLMSLPVLVKIKDLVNSGATIVGNKPISSPSLSDDQAKFKAIADELWKNENGDNVVGKGRVSAGKSIGQVLNDLKIAPDFTYSKPGENTKLLYVHRRTSDTDIYWVNSRNNTSENVEARFRIEGKIPEIWHPDNGITESASYLIEGRLTTVSLKLDPNDAQFVVFRKKAEKSSLTLPPKEEKVLATIDGPWNLRFQPDRGAPDQIKMDSLTAWNESPNTGIKYFSGTGSYNKTLNIPSEWIKNGREVWLDLGTVRNLAEVSVNGKDLGIIWKKPFRVNITGAIKEGENQLEIKVTNLWVNRLIGDQQPGIQKKFTYTTMQFYKADAPLQPSGLTGPVQIVSVGFK